MDLWQLLMKKKCKNNIKIDPWDKTFQDLTSAHGHTKHRLGTAVGQCRDYVFGTTGRCGDTLSGQNVENKKVQKLPSCTVICAWWGLQGRGRAGGPIKLTFMGSSCLGEKLLSFEKKRFFHNFFTQFFFFFFLAFAMLHFWMFHAILSTFHIVVKKFFKPKENNAVHKSVHFSLLVLHSSVGAPRCVTTQCSQAFWFRLCAKADFQGGLETEPPRLRSVGSVCSKKSTIRSWWWFSCISRSMQHEMRYKSTDKFIWHWSVLFLHQCHIRSQLFVCSPIYNTHKCKLSIKGWQASSVCLWIFPILHKKILTPRSTKDEFFGTSNKAKYIIKCVW